MNYLAPVPDSGQTAIFFALILLAILIIIAITYFRRRNRRNKEIEREKDGE